MSTSSIIDDTEKVIKDINIMRANPNSDEIRTKIKNVLYTQKGFGKEAELIADFAERFLDQLPKMRKLKEVEPKPELTKLAEKLCEYFIKNKTNPRDLSDSEIENVSKPFIIKYGKLRIVADEQNEASRFIGKMVMKKDSQNSTFGKGNYFYDTLFDPDLKFYGISKKKLDKRSLYVIVFVDKYQKPQKLEEGVLTSQEIDELREIFNLFDTDEDEYIIPSDFNSLADEMGIFKKIPALEHFANFLNQPDLQDGCDFDNFCIAFWRFGNYENNDDAIRRVFELYVDDVERDTITLHGMKRIIKELKVKKLEDEIFDLFNNAINKEVEVNYQEFKTYIVDLKKRGKIQLPRKI